MGAGESISGGKLAQICNLRINVAKASGYGIGPPKINQSNVPVNLILWPVCHVAIFAP